MTHRYSFKQTSTNSEGYDISIAIDSDRKPKAIDVFRSIVGNNLHKGDSVSKYGNIGNALGMTYAETFGIVIEQMHEAGLDIDYNSIHKTVKKGFNSMRHNL